MARARRMSLRTDARTGEVVLVPAVHYPVYARATLLADGSVRVDAVNTPYGGGNVDVTGTVDPEGAIRMRAQGYIPQRLPVETFFPIDL